MKDRAFRLIYEEHSRMVSAYLHSCLGDWHEASDLTQETFLVAYRKMKTFRTGESLPAWLRGIARNLARNALRARNKEALRIDKESVECVYRSLDDDKTDGRWETRLRHLDHCLEQLPEQQRRSLDLYYEQERSAPQIADELKVKPKTVYQIMWHARNALRDCLEQALHTGEKAGTA